MKLILFRAHSENLQTNNASKARGSANATSVSPDITFTYSIAWHFAIRLYHLELFSMPQIVSTERRYNRQTDRLRLFHEQMFVLREIRPWNLLTSEAEQEGFCYSYLYLMRQYVTISDMRWYTCFGTVKVFKNRELKKMTEPKRVLLEN